MGLFGLRDDRREQDPQLERLYEARNAYDERRNTFRGLGETLEVTCKSGQDWLTNTRLRLRIDEDDFVLFPEVNAYDISEPEALDRLTETVLPRTEYHLEHTSPTRHPVREEGEHLFFEWPGFEFTLCGPQSAVLCVQDLSRACSFFAQHPDVIHVRALFDLWDGPSHAVVFERKNTVTSDPAGRYDMWREGDDLYFYQEPGPYRRKPEYLEVWHWPLSAISYYREKGAVSQEYLTFGGELEFDQSAAWRPHLTHVGYLEDAVSLTPVRTEKVEHDNRYAELVLADHRTLKLPYSSLDSLHKLMPEKEFDKLATQSKAASSVVSGREPTPVEQLKILADLVDRGYLTREEYDAAKPRLLEKL